jgi:hypothetical protein
MVVDPGLSAWASERGALSHLDSFQVDDMACEEWRATMPKLIVDGVGAVDSFTTSLKVSSYVYDAMVARLLSLCYAWDRQHYENAMQAIASPIGASTEVPQFAPTQVAGARDVRRVTIPSTFAMDLRKLPWVPIEPQGGSDNNATGRTRSGPRSQSRGSGDAVSRTASGASREASGENASSLTVSVAKFTFVPTEALKKHFGPLVNFLSAEVFTRVKDLQFCPSWFRIEKQLGLRRWSSADGEQRLAMLTIGVLNEWSKKAPDEVPMLSVAQMEKMCVIGAVYCMS